MTSREFGRRLCDQFLEILPVTGASISVISGFGQSTIGVTDRIAALVEELQFDLGEGPHGEALLTGKPVLVSDLSAEGGSRWPILCVAASDLGIRAMFSFPMTLGAVTVGVVDLYRTETGGLDKRLVSRALSLASSTAAPSLRIASGLASEESPANTVAIPELRRVVHQATGMVIAQLGVTATEAFTRMQAYAFSCGTSLELVAQDVVMRRLNFRNLDE